MTRRTILHTIETAGPGGAETVLLRLASGLNEDRFRSLALLPQEGWLADRLRERGVPVVFANSNRWYDLRLPMEMKRLIDRERVDLVHSHLPGQNFYGCVAGLLTGRKKVVTYHGAFELARSQGWKGNIRLAAVRKMADAVVAVCDYVGRLLRGAHFSPKKIVRIYNGIGMETFGSAGDERIRRELNLPSGTRLVGTVANLRGPKGYAFLIQAARLVIDRFPECHFVAVGDIDAVLGRPLFDLVERLKLTNQFHFLGFRSDVPEILSELDVFVLASVSEGFPLVALEAMAASKAVVMTRSGGQQEVVEDGVSGLLVPPGDARGLAVGIGELLANPERAAEMAWRARCRVEADFTVEKMLREHETLYERLLEVE